MTQNSIKILIFGLETSTSNALLKEFRGAGYAVRSQVVETEADVERSLFQGADLFIGDAIADKDTLAEITGKLRSFREQIPIILLGDTAGIAGGQLLMPKDQTGMIVQSAIREFQALQTRRELQATQRRLEESEQRSELLFQRSESAIAYVVDGIVVNCNQAFARFFKNSEPEDLLAEPFVDLFHDEDREALKRLLKTGTGARDDQLHPRSFELPVPVHAADARYEEESCRQLTLSVPASGDSEADAAVNDDADPLQDAIALGDDLELDGLATEPAAESSAAAELAAEDEPAPHFEVPVFDEQQLRFQALISLKGISGELYELGLSDGDAALLEAEHCGSAEFDRNLIVAACKQLAAQRQQQASGIRLIVPASRQIFGDEDFANWLAVALKAGGLNGEALLLSLDVGTATELAKDEANCSRFVSELSALGVQLALRGVSDTAQLDEHDRAVLNRFQPSLICADPISDNDVLRGLMQCSHDDNARFVMAGIDDMSGMANAFRFSPDYIKGAHLHSPSSEMDYDFSDLAD